MNKPEKRQTSAYHQQQKTVSKWLAYAGIMLFTFVLYQCSSRKPVTNTTPVVKTDSVAAKKPDTVNWNISNVISPKAAITKMRLETGFEAKLVAAEPLVSTPVAVTFDDAGRIWAVEMNGYMPDTSGTGEDAPTGKVVILEDKNSDGEFDTRKVFLDSLRLPRALCLIADGMLVAEPPRLWFYPINNDKPGKRTLVDAHYTAEGNVEHHPNGLLRAMDNWIYNAKATKRYRKQGDKWLIENTHFRGQWGISQDNYGRLYYNDNSSNVYGDYFLPGFGAGNADEVNVAGFSERIVADNHVYPIRPTPGINRGYTPGMLDDSLRLVNFTAACAPLVYRGNAFGADHDNNVFVAEPSANLVKRNIINSNGYVTKGMQAYKGKEFLASTDERFRPVNLYNGPDGAFYVVDMYRGIIQHKTYLTDYLRREIGKRKLSQPVNCGRIYKIVPQGNPLKAVVMPHDAQQLVAMLGDANGWIRDKAQQMLVDGKQTAAIPALQQALTSGNNLQAIHALWVLEGLHALKADNITVLLNNNEWWVRSQALAVIPSVINKVNYKAYVAMLQQYMLKNDAQTAPYIAFLCDAIKRYDKPAADNLLKTLAKQYAADKYVADAVISNLNGREAQFKSIVADTNLVFNKHLKTVIAHRVSRLQNHDPVKLQKEFPKGAAIFSSTCQTCHGNDGNGIRMLAPPLNRSQWINGEPKKLLSIVLAGLTGPVEVNGHLYKAPEITADMPGIGASEFSDEDIAQLLSYLRQSWQNNAGKITTEQVSVMRKSLKTREKAFTMEELNKLYPPNGN